MRHSRRKAPLGADLAPILARMKEMADASANALLLTDEPPCPDAPLLDICAGGLHAVKAAASARHTVQQYISGSQMLTVEERAAYDALSAECMSLDTAARTAMRRAGKINATTPAGIYAKALLVRASADGSPVLARSLADDFISCRMLRESLWPSGDVPA